MYVVNFNFYIDLYNHPKINKSIFNAITIKFAQYNKIKNNDGTIV